jgi:acetyl-CoA C-acetyltransferase
MGVTAENVAAKYGITREMQDAQAVESHQRAERATAEGRFAEQIVPVMLKSRKGDVAYTTDEHFRSGATLADFAKLKPVFLKENGTVTAGNASGINDAAAALVLMEGQSARARGLQPMARLVGYAHTGLDPKIMGVGPISATQAVLKRTGLTVNDLDVIEANEAFAAWAWTRPRSTPTARAFRWATRSAPPVR